MSSSPYSKTKMTNSGTLDILTIRPVPAYADDPIYTIEPQYNHRPDLLAFDLYGDHKLWWIFAQRNLDAIEDPIYDIVAGTKIYLPAAERVKQVLGT
jgi:hypothetical protein|tara:strand:- start:77 stop:367 length:291 start_codon:yes stop_codon:yes gene_type:complete